MGNAVWLFLATPDWYFSAAVSAPSFSTNFTILFGALPLAGTIGLVVGVILGVMGRHIKLAWLLASPLLSQLFLVVSGLLRGQVHNPVALWVLGAFLVVQVILLLFLIVRLRGVRVPAASLSVFGITYAVFASFVAGMSFTDDWL